MTTWVDDPGGGRDRGPRGVARAWIEVLVRPRRFFRVGVAPGDQAPGLVFADAVAVAYVLGRIAAAPGAVPEFAGGPTLSLAVLVLAVALAVAPAALHLTAALQTVLLIVTVDDRAGVSETVQTIGYAAAPCALAGLPLPIVGPGVAALAPAYGTFLLLLGLATVHETSFVRAALAGVVPAYLVFGLLFGGQAAVLALLDGIAPV